MLVSCAKRTIAQIFETLEMSLTHTINSKGHNMYSSETPNVTLYDSEWTPLKYQTAYYWTESCYFTLSLHH